MARTKEEMLEIAKPREGREQAYKDVEALEGKLTVDVFKNVLPKSHRKMVTPELMDRLNAIGENQVAAESFKENLISYTTVLKDGRFKLEDYINAVKFVSFKLLNNSDTDAYIKTFPDRYNRLVAEGLGREEVSGYAWAYKKNKLVTTITEQSLVPSHILNAPLHQEAINVATSLMYNARSELTRLKAAEAVIAATKPPESSKIALEIGYNEETRNNQMAVAEQIAKFALQQQEFLSKGYSISEVQKLNLVRPESIEDAEIDEDE